MPAGPPAVLVCGDDPLCLGLVRALGMEGLDASPVPRALAVDGVRAMAPDLLVAVCDDGVAERALLAELGEDSAGALVPLVVVGPAANTDPVGPFALGVVGRIDRELQVARIAAETRRILSELPQRTGEQRGLVEEATLDELVDVLGRELRTGVLSVHGKREAKIVLRAGRPLDQQVDSFMQRVRPMLIDGEPVHYEFHEQVSMRIDSLLPNAPAPASASLHGRRLLVVDEDMELAAEWTRALRGAGAQVIAFNDPFATLEAARALDPEVIVMDPECLEGPMATLLRRLRKDPRLRWTASLMVPVPKHGSDGITPTQVRSIAQKVSELCAPHQELRARASQERSFELRLEQVGPSQLLRTLLEVDRRLRLRVTHTQAVVTLDLAKGRILGAEGRRLDAGGRHEGHEALGLLLTMRSGRAHVEPVTGVPLSNLEMDLEIALAMAAPERRQPLASLPPPALVSRIPPAPKLPRIDGRAPRPLMAEPLLQTVDSLGSSANPMARIGLLLTACLVGAVVGLPAWLDPLQLDNTALEAAAMGPTPDQPRGLPRSGRIPVQPQRAERLALEADELQLRGRQLKAEARYLAALLSQDSNLRALEGLAQLKLEAGDAAAATDWTLRLLVHAPDEGRFHALLGDVHRLAGREAAAEEAYKHARRLGADAPEPAPAGAQ